MNNGGNWDHCIQYADGKRILLFMPAFNYKRVAIDIYFGSYYFFPWREARIEIDVIDYKNKTKKTHQFFINHNLRAERFVKAYEKKIVADLEYDIYRYGTLDNCTCEYIMDKDDKYIETITKPDDKCLSHGDVWEDD